MVSKTQKCRRVLNSSNVAKAYLIGYKNILLENDKTIPLTFISWQKLSISNTLCLGRVKKGRKRDFNARFCKSLEAKVWCCCSWSADGAVYHRENNALYQLSFQNSFRVIIRKMMFWTLAFYNLYCARIWLEVFGTRLHAWFNLCICLHFDALSKGDVKMKDHETYKIFPKKLLKD